MFCNSGRGGDAGGDSTACTSKLGAWNPFAPPWPGGILYNHAYTVLAYKPPWMAWVFLDQKHQAILWMELAFMLNRPTWAQQ
jgi:hypothetical protein